MKEAIITVAVFFLLLFLMAQIRFLRLIRKLKMNDKTIAGGLFLADLLGSCIEGCCKIGCLIYREERKNKVRRAKDKEFQINYEIKSVIEELKRKEEMDYQSEEDKNKVKDLISKRQKTSIMYISNRTLLPKERIIDIILEDPDFMIEREYVINKKMLTKKEIKSQELKAIEEKIAKGICPTCNNPFEPNRVYCSNCGYVLKQEKIP